MSIIHNLPNADGYYGHESVDADAAQKIAEIATKKAGKNVCPLIGECHRRCMSIVNTHPYHTPAHKLITTLRICYGMPMNPDDDDYAVGIKCDNPENNIPIDVLKLPLKLLQRDSLPIGQHIECMLTDLINQ